MRTACVEAGSVLGFGRRVEGEMSMRSEAERTRTAWTKAKLKIEKSFMLL